MDRILKSATLKSIALAIALATAGGAVHAQDLTVGWNPRSGDVFMACNIAAIIGRPCRYVVEAYERDRGHGWGNIAKQMGIKPGSPEFHRLKKGFVPTYDRWARPITLDVELERAYPNRGKGHGNGKSGNGHGKSQTGNSHGGNGHGSSAKSDHGKGKSGGQKGKSGNKGGGNGKGKG